MADPNSIKNPRLVVYLTKPEMRLAKLAATSEGHKNPHRWAATLIRKTLATTAR